MSVKDLIRKSARDLVRSLARREVSPLELIDASAERIAEVDPAVNALPTLCLDRARAAAERIMDDPPADPPPGYLYGMPVTVKDLSAVAGVRTTYGSPIHADNVPAASDFVVERMEAMGAVVIAKSNTPEFGAGSNTFNEVFGVTKNPWNTTTTCGGSSGGAAVSLATGEAWLAHGSDMGGSLRIPASYCSVVGLRPSPGRVPAGPGNLCFGNLGVQGPMGRDVGDCALLFDAQVGYDPRDPLSLEAPDRMFVDAVDRPTRPKRVAWSPNLGISPVDPEVASICYRATRRFEELGVAVEEACPDLSEARDIFQIERAVSFASDKEPTLRDHRDKLKPEVVWNIEKGLALTAADIGRTARARTAVYRRVARFFERYDILACPTVMAPPFDHSKRYLDQVNGVAFDNYVDWLMLTFLITVTCCPAISIPAGFTSSGLPVGLQLVAPLREEAKLLSASALLESLLGIAKAVPIDPRTP